MTFLMGFKRANINQNPFEYKKHVQSHSTVSLQQKMAGGQVTHETEEGLSEWKTVDMPAFPLPDQQSETQRGFVCWPTPGLVGRRWICSQQTHSATSQSRDCLLPRASPNQGSIFSKLTSVHVTHDDYLSQTKFDCPPAKVGLHCSAPEVTGMQLCDHSIEANL